MKLDMIIKICCDSEDFSACLDDLGDDCIDLALLGA